MTGRGWTAALLALGLLCQGLTPAMARDVYVAPEGAAQTADGSPKAPYQSIRAALLEGEAGSGDRIVLQDGSYGALRIVNQTFALPLQIVAQNPGAAHFESIEVRKSGGIHFDGLSVWPSTLGTGARNLVMTHDNAEDIRFNRMDIRSGVDAPDRYFSWSQDQWLSDYRSNGIRLNGPDNAVTNSQFSGVTNGITTTGDRALVSGNRIAGFSADAMRGLGDGSIFSGNMVKDAFDVDENHDDGFQSWATKKDAQGRKTVSDITIENNVILEWTGPANHPLRSRLQGIGLFDGIYKNFTIRNNLIAIDAYHGIALYGGTDSQIVNNTVVHISGGPAEHPWILLRDNRNGWKSGPALVKNNAAMSYRGIKSAARTNAVTRYPAQLFRDPARLDFQLKPDSPLVNAGTSEDAPLGDIQGTPRDERPDLGAFELR